MLRKTLTTNLFLIMGLLLTTQLVVRAQPLAPQNGNLSGTVTYTGAIGGTHEIIVAAHPALDAPPIASDHILSGESYTLANVLDGAYYISAFLDVNDSGGGPPDAGEPVAYYDANNDGTADPVTVSGNTVTGLNISLTDGGASEMYVSGQVSYVGTAVDGNHDIILSAHTQLGDPPLYSVHVPGPSNAYTLSLTSGDYYLIAFLDADDSGGGPPDNGEPLGIYDDNGDGLPDLLSIADTPLTGIDLTLYDAFVEGTAVYQGGIAGDYLLEVALHEVIDQEPVAYTRLPTPGGAYTLSYLPGRYYVSAFVDFDGSSGPPDTNELFTYYDGDGDGLPDLVDVFTQTVTIDFALGQIIYVDASASGNNDGTSWADAYPDLSSALASAPPHAEIWLAEGTYTPGTSREESFVLQNNVAIYGGFAGDEQWRHERDFAQNAAILSGDIGTAVVKTDNAYHVVTSSETDHTAVLDGVIISGGYANSEGFHDKGGGILNINGSPTLANLRLLDNYAMNHGAGMVNVGTDATPLLINCEFSGNRTAFNGAFANLNGANPTLINTTLTGNLGGNSGGVANISSHATLINTILWGNQGPEISLQLGATISVSHSIVTGGYAGVGNLSSDPLFVDADGADNLFGTLDDDLHLQAGSPAIDAGDNTAVPADSGDSDGDADVIEPFPFDRDQQARRLDDPDTPDSGHGTTPLVDIGADEFALVEPSGLTALNNSPTLLGTATSFTATVQSGNGLTYAWAFGDGQVGSGAQVSHTYALPGLYTAVVTASNSLGAKTTSTPVSVYEALSIPPSQPTTTADGVVRLLSNGNTAVDTLHYTPLPAPTPATGNLTLGQVAFQLQAYDSQGQPITGPLDPPLILTIQYDDTGWPSWLEAHLTLRRYDEATSQWLPLTMLGQDTIANKLMVELDHLSEFALLGEEPLDITHTIYLPLIHR